MNIYGDYYSPAPIMELRDFSAFSFARFSPLLFAGTTPLVDCAADFDFM
jgi:hypothetical protein